MKNDSEQKTISKKCIQFRTGTSSERRNVDKHIVRSVLLYHLKLKEKILAEYERRGLSPKHFTIACESLKTIKELEKVGRGSKAEREETKETESKRERKRTKRDYGKTINTMLNLLEMQLIMKCCLEYSLEQLSEKKVSKSDARVKEKNKKVYNDALEDYLEYIKGLLNIK